MILPLLAAAVAACGLPTTRAAGAPWRPGEQIGFDIDVMGVVKAGTLSLAVGQPMFKGTEVPISARVRNTSVFAKIRKVNGLAMSWVMRSTLKPERYREE